MDVVAFGRLVITSLELEERARLQAPLNRYDRPTAMGEVGAAAPIIRR